MYELLASGGKKRGALYPDSGPGSIELVKGDETFGYFGSLSAAEFFTAAELSLEADYSEGNVYITNPEWIKVMMDGKVLFIPSRPIRNNPSWNGLYNAGLVYGDGTIGKYPIGAGVAQDKTVSKSGSLFRVRLFGKGDTDPSPLNTGTTSQSPGSYEFGRFCTKIYDAAVGGHFADSWKLYSVAFINGVIPTQIPTNNANTAYTSFPYWRFRSNNYFLDGYIMVKTTPTAETPYWWPVLELLPNTVVLPIKEVYGNGWDTLVPGVITDLIPEGEFVKPTYDLFADTVGIKAGALTELTFEKAADWTEVITSITNIGMSPVSVYSITYEP